MFHCGDIDLREATKRSRVTLKELERSAGQMQEAGHRTVIAGLYGRVVSHMISCYEFGETHVGDVVNMWKMVWMRFFGLHLAETQHPETTMSTVKHGAGGILLRVTITLFTVN